MDPVYKSCGGLIGRICLYTKQERIVMDVVIYARMRENRPIVCEDPNDLVERGHGGRFDGCMNSTTCPEQKIIAKLQEFSSSITKNRDTQSRNHASQLGTCSTYYISNLKY